MPDSEHLLYVGSYAAAEEPGIYAFSLDAASGALTAHGAAAGVAKPSFIALHPSGRWLYTVSETGQKPDGAPGSVWALDIASAPVHPAPINQQPSGGDWPCHLAIDPGGRWLLVANYATGSVGVLPIGADGALGPLSDLAQHEGRGPHPERQTGPHAHSATFSPDGRFVIVADLGIDALVTYAFDAAAGRLHLHGQTATRPGAGPRHLAFHPDGRHVYVANELDNTVALYDYDPAGGTPHAQQIAETLPPGAPENTVADIHVATAGDRVYVSNRGHDSVAIFAAARDGRLARLAVPPCGGRWPRNFAIAPGGRFLVVADQYSDALVVLPVLDGATGLGAPVARAVVPGAACVKFVTPK